MNFPRVVVAFLCGLLPAAFLLSTAAAQSGDPAPGRIVNFSVRAHSGSGDSVLIAGFVLAGDNTRPLLLRAVGPGLLPYGVTSAMLDPELALFRTGSQQVVNDSWGSGPDLLAAQRQLGAFDLTESSRDAAALLPLAPGSYTAHARPRNGVPGEVLLELYDAAGAHDESPAIANVSLRGDVAVPDGVLIGGFVIGPGAPRRVLLRAVGPTLAQFGVARTLPDPRIVLYHGSNPIQQNQDWGADGNAAALAAVFASSGAFGLPEGSRDAALLATLAPGAYTAHVTDPNGGTGIVLMEVYDLEPQNAAGPLPLPGPGGVLPVVTMSASSDRLVEGAIPGATITLVRAGDVSQPLRVRLAWTGTASASDITGVPASVVFAANSATAKFSLGAWGDLQWEPGELVSVSLQPDAAYTIGASGLVHLIIRDTTPLWGNGWRGEYFNNRTLTGAPVLTRQDGEINFNWDTNAPDAVVPRDSFSVRWTGLLQVDTTQDYTFITATDDGVRLWVDDQLIIDKWVNQGRVEHTATIPLAAGVRYLVRMEYFDNTSRAVAELHWQAAGMPRAIIPAGRVFEGGDSAPAITSPTSAIALQGGPFSYTVTASARPETFAVTGLPPGLTFDAASRTISGMPAVGGDFKVVLTSSNAHGTGAEILNLSVLAAGLSVQGETWNTAGLTPLSVPTMLPDAVASLSMLQSAAPADAVFERVRGYITAPLSGNYEFWIASSGPSEFYLSDSDQPGDRVRRAGVTSGTAAQQWTFEASQRSALIALTAGQRYYFEIRHAPAPGTMGGAHVALAWRTPGQAAGSPAGIVPGYVLVRFSDLAPVEEGKVVYIASLRPMAGVNTPASGTVSLLFDDAALLGTLALRFSGLSSAETSAYIYAGEEGSVGAQIRGLPLGQFSEYAWTLRDTGSLTARDIADALRDGLLYVVVHTADFPGGELRGQFGAAAGSSVFHPPSDPPALPSGLPDAGAASRFLQQATFGPTPAEILRVQQIGYEAWLNEQFALPATEHTPYIDARAASLALLDPPQSVSQNHRQEVWWLRSVTAPDQLRQRVAFALSEIFVVSDVGVLSGEVVGLGVWNDMLLRDAFGNFRTLLEDVTLSPAMANYLTMIRNRKPDPARGIYPDENYAREVMQLFTVGLNKLHPDGTLILDTAGLPIPTYTNETIVGLAHVFTGWAYHSTAANPSFLSGARNFRHPLMMYEAYHDTGEKRLLDSTVLAGGRTGVQDLQSALDHLFAHPNVGPFVCRQLIQRLVTSNPGPGYVYRVARVFDDNGAGVRGDLRAVIRAILLDHEARSPAIAATQGFGKLREPVLRLTQLWRALGGAAPSGLYVYTAAQNSLAQAPLRSPTVFNFFEPAYVHPGILASAGLVAPEYQITTETTIVRLSNEMRTAVFTGLGPGSDRIVLDLASLQALSDDPAQLVATLDTLLMGGTMSEGMRATMISAVTAIPSTSPRERAQTAVNLVIVSPEYAIQK